MSWPDGKRVLLVTKNDFSEERDGGAKRTAAVVRTLVREGYEVDVVAVRPHVLLTSQRPPRPSKWEVLRIVSRVLIACFRTRSVSACKWFTFSAANSLAALTTDPNRTYVGSFVEFSQITPYRAVLPHPVVLDMHNIESELLANYAESADSIPRRAAALYEASRMRALESRLHDQFDLIATVSVRDREHLTTLGTSTGSSGIVVAPNGVDDECFDFEGHRNPTVVFVAHLGWRPNIDAAKWLVQQVWPYVRLERPELDLLLVGREPDAAVWSLAADDVHIHANVDSPIPYVGSALAATAPLLAAGGTRLKILEGLATGTPVVATSLGALGLEALEGSGLSIADDPEEFARALLSAASTTTERAAIRSRVEAYRWRSALEPLASAFNRAVADHGGE